MSSAVDRLEGNMWDANIACKCLGRCPLDRFETLGLAEPCAYDHQQALAMEYVFADADEA